MEAELADLERVQTQILERISKLELSHLPQNAESLPSSSPTSKLASLTFYIQRGQRLLFQESPLRLLRLASRVPPRRPRRRLCSSSLQKHRFVRLAPEETSIKLTGYERNAVTCIGMQTDIPVILGEAIVKLNPDFFWLGGGEVDLKLGIRTSEFINFVKPFIFSCGGT